MNKVTAFIDSSSGLFNHPIVGEKSQKEFEIKLIEEYSQNMSNIIERYKLVKPFLTLNLGEYLTLLNEAKRSYTLGLYYSTVSMVGITAERYTIEISENVDNQIVRALRKGGKNQFDRLRILKTFNIIDKEIFENLDCIRDIRNRYTHPSSISNPEKDSIEVLNKMIEVVNIEFNKKYIIKNGKITLKK